MSVLPVGFGSALGGYQIERSLRFNSADSAYLNRTPASAGNRKTWTWSGWVKRSVLGTDQVFFGAYDNSTQTDAVYAAIGFASTNTLFFGAWTQNWRTTTQVFRDVSAWYHIVIVLDTTQSTASNRAKVYINGSEVTAFGTSNNPTLNADLGINATNQHGLGRINYLTGSGPYYSNVYMTEVNFVDGQALTPSDFGETDSATGVWKPKAYSGTYGTNGFFLKFADNSGTTSTTLGKDSSGNGNNWTPNNFSVTAGAGNDSLVDSPTAYGTDTGVGGEVRGNYATLNPLQNRAADTFSDGNLKVVTSSSNYGTFTSTIAIPTTGKWYCEATITATASYPAVGIVAIDSNFTTTSWIGSLNGVAYYGNSGQKFVNATGSAYGASYTTNDVIGIAYDADNATITFYKNNTSQGSITGVTARTYYFGGSEWDAASGTQVWNFGQRAFAYTAPSGFKALCTTNLPTPTIGATSTTQANDYFNVVTYTGTLSTVGSNQLVTGVGFQPDMTWIKCRSNAADNIVADAIRYVSTADNNYLVTNSTAAEADDQNTFRGFASDGFNVGYYDVTGNTGKTYVAWNWNAGGSNATNTSGTITSTVRANTTSGFSIVTYTGNGSNATVGHGLGVAPQMIICMNRGGGNYFPVYHVTNTASKTQWLQIQNAASSDTAYWQGVTPTTSVFSVGTNTNINANGSTYVAYCFAPVAGYSAFGSYTGNGSTDGPFVYTNFRPEYVMVKRTDSTGEWMIVDAARSTFNLVTRGLYANASDAEGTGDDFDFLSNGFKLRDSGAGNNASGGTYIYMAFAEFPFKFSLAR